MRADQHEIALRSRMRIPENFTFYGEVGHVYEISMWFYWGKANRAVDGIKYIFDDVSNPIHNIIGNTHTYTGNATVPYVLPFVNDDAISPPFGVWWDVWFALEINDTTAGRYLPPYLFAFSTSPDNNLREDGSSQAASPHRGKITSPSPKYYFAPGLFQIVFAPENYFLASDNGTHYAFGGDYYAYNTLGTNTITIWFFGENDSNPNGSQYFRTDRALNIKYKIKYTKVGGAFDEFMVWESSVSVPINATSAQITLPSGFNVNQKGWFTIYLEADSPDYVPLLKTFHCSVGWYLSPFAPPPSLMPTGFSEASGAFTGPQDINGLFYYVGTDYRTRQFRTPGYDPFVSSLNYKKIATLAGGTQSLKTHNVFNRYSGILSPQSYYFSPGPNILPVSFADSFILFDLGPYLKVRMGSYMMMTRPDTDSGHMRNWKIWGAVGGSEALEAYHPTNPGLTWVLIDTKANETSLTGLNTVVNFPVTSATFYRYILLENLGNNSYVPLTTLAGNIGELMEVEPNVSTYHHRIILQEFEIYGTYREQYI